MLVNFSVHLKLNRFISRINLVYGELLLNFIMVDRHGFYDKLQELKNANDEYFKIQIKSYSRRAINKTEVLMNNSLESEPCSFVSSLMKVKVAYFNCCCL